MIRLVFFASFFVLQQLNVYATNNQHARYLGIEHGLSNNYVTSIFQDKTGFMWFGTFDGLNRYDGYQIKTYRNVPDQLNSLPDNRIIDITEDTSGNIWVGTKVGAAMLDSDEMTFHRLRLALRNEPVSDIDFSINGFIKSRNGTLYAAAENEGLLQLTFSTENGAIAHPIALSNNGNISTDYHVNCVAIDLDGRIWLFVQDIGLCYYNPQRNLVQLTASQIPPASCMGISPDGYIWLGTEEGLIRYHPKTKSITPFTIKNGLSHHRIASLHLGSSNKLWIGTDGGGVTVMDLKTGAFEHLLGHDEGGILSSPAVFAIYEDKQSRKWVGTLRGGINIIDPPQKNFEIVRHTTNEGRTSSKNFILSLTEDKRKSLWIGTDGAGLIHWDRRTNKFRYFTDQDTYGSLSSNFVTHIIEENNGLVWVATFGGGINKWNPSTEQFEHYPCIDTELDRNYRNVWQLYEDSSNQLWATTLSGGRPFILNRSTNRFEPISADITNALTMVEETKNIFWFGNFSELIRLDLSDGQTTRYDIGTSVRCIHIGHDHRLWIGTEGGGLLEFNKETETFKRYTESDGLPSNVILQLQEDKSGNYWLSTYNGLAKFDPVSGTFRNFHESDGLQSNQFSYNASAKLQSGELAFGGINGFNVFHPDSIDVEFSLPTIALTDFRVNSVFVNKYVAAEKRENLSELTNLTIPFKDASITISFSALEFSFPDKIQYAYFLEGWDNDWNDVGSQRTAHYSRLNEGKYLLRMKSTNANGLWSDDERTVELIILPPWWRASWAYCIYLLFSASLIYAYITHDRRQTKLKYEVDLARMAIEKERELNEKKVSFFTHIAHEFRTPLTLILNPIKELLYGSQQTVDSKELSPIYRNAKRLLSLVDKLLVFQRTESQFDSLRIARANIKHIVHEVFLCFKQVAASRQITYTFDCPTADVEVYGDREKIEICLINLISNAIKFTPEDGKVAISIVDTEDDIEITVSDSGCGIPNHVGDALFTRFYRDYQGTGANTEGFGIGLYLVKQFIEAHNGDIYYKSTPGKGTKFILRFQKGKAHFEGQLVFEDINEHSLFLDEWIGDLSSDRGRTATIERTEPVVEIPAVISDRPIMLVVDDNEQIREYVSRIFLKECTVYTSANADEAMILIEKYEPNIVITDVVMNGTSGIDLCAAIKNHNLFSHIPIILLSASTSKEIELKGIESGADDYITKPFEQALLKARVQNLLQRSDSLQHYFYNEITLQNNHHKISSEYSEFLNQCIFIVESQLGNPDFNVKVLADEIGMSHSNLYKRIKSISGKSANEFIRFIRLRKVAQTLISTNCTINEAAFDAGFNDIKYFRTQFAKVFGMKPSDYKRRYKSMNKKLQLNME